MAQPAFLTQFTEKMDRLNKVRGAIQSSIQSKEAFASELKTRLVDVKTRLQQLTGLIDNMKANAAQLETRISTNANSIADKEREMQPLREQVAALTAERDNLVARVAQQDNEAKTQIAQRQQTIDACEAQLRDIQLKYKEQTIELNALREEMSKTGDEKDAAHAAQLQQMSEQSLQQAQQQEAGLLQKISDCEAKIAGFEAQLKDKDAALAQKQQELDDALKSTQGASQGLQAQIDALKQENEQLVQRLIAATEAINLAADDLERLMSAAPNAQNKQEIDALLNDINQQIEASMENIGRAAQGQPAVPSGPYDVDANFANLMDWYKLDNKNEYNNVLKKHVGQINVKPINDNIKFAEKGNPSAVDVIKRILKANEIKVPALRTTGGRRRRVTRKYKKQKKQQGGFTYSTHTKRKSISSKSATTKSVSKRTSR